MINKSLYYHGVAAGEAAPWKKLQILIFIFLYSFEVSSKIELNETFIFVQFVFIYALMISDKWLGGIRGPAQNLFTLYNTYRGGVLIPLLPIGGITNLIFSSNFVLLISGKSTCRISISEKSCLVQNKLYAFHIEFMLTFHNLNFLKANQRIKFNW